MKKILLLAAFGVAGLVSANNSVVKKADVKEINKATVAIQLCGVMVTYFNSAGEPTGQQWYTSDQPTLDACQSYQNGVISDLQRQGYRVQKASTGLSNDIN